MNVAEGDALPGWREWSEEQCATVHRIAGPLMSEYGYGQEPEWLARVAPLSPSLSSPVSPPPAASTPPGESS